jgi:hypothetical protein
LDIFCKASTGTTTLNWCAAIKASCLTHAPASMPRPLDFCASSRRRRLHRGRWLDGSGDLARSRSNASARPLNWYVVPVPMCAPSTAAQHFSLAVVYVGVHWDPQRRGLGEAGAKPSWARVYYIFMSLFIFWPCKIIFNMKILMQNGVLCWVHPDPNGLHTVCMFANRPKRTKTDTFRF